MKRYQGSPSSYAAFPFRNLFTWVQVISYNNFITEKCREVRRKWLIEINEFVSDM